MKQGLVEITENIEPGYKPLIYFEGWRVAVLNDDPDRFRRETVSYLERYNETAEQLPLLEMEGK